MKPRVLIPILASLFITLGGSCKKSSGDDKEPYELSKTEWRGEATMYNRAFKPMEVSFQENKQLKVVFTAVDDPNAKFTFYGTWEKADDSDDVSFQFQKGLETVTSTCKLTENNTKMDGGKFKTSADPDLDAGDFTLTRQ